MITAKEYGAIKVNLDKEINYLKYQGSDEMTQKIILTIELRGSGG